MLDLFDKSLYSNFHNILIQKPPGRGEDSLPDWAYHTKLKKGQKLITAEFLGMNVQEEMYIDWQLEAILD